MRAIKFRAWDGKEFLPLAREIAFIDDDGVLRSRIEGIIFNQFIGLTDRLGQHIYEGDILRWECGGAQILEVRWENNYFTLLNVRSQTTVLVASMKQVEVIGNIYQTPELLERHPIDAETPHEPYPYCCEKHWVEHGKTWAEEGVI